MRAGLARTPRSENNNESWQFLDQHGSIRKRRLYAYTLFHSLMRRRIVWYGAWTSLMRQSSSAGRAVDDEMLFCLSAVVSFYLAKTVILMVPLCRRRGILSVYSISSHCCCRNFVCILFPVVDYTLQCTFSSDVSHVDYLRLQLRHSIAFKKGAMNR
jgi:hypothetical protein